MAKLKVTLKRSLISRPETQRRTIKALGLGRINSYSIQPDNECTRGQIFKVKHLVAVEEVADDVVGKKARKSKISTKKNVEQQEVEAK